MKSPEKLIARALASFSRADAKAVSLMRTLARSPFLTPEEQAHAARLAPEEREHSRMAEAHARKLGMVSRPPLDGYSAITARDTAMVCRVPGSTGLAWLLAGLTWNETQSVREMPRWGRVFHRLGYRDLALDLEQLVQEERGHVELGTSVAQRLSNTIPGFHSTYRQYWKLTARAGVAILSATFGPTLTQLEAATRGMKENTL